MSSFSLRHARVIGTATKLAREVLPADAFNTATPSLMTMRPQYVARFLERFEERHPNDLPVLARLARGGFLDDTNIGRVIIDQYQQRCA